MSKIEIVISIVLGCYFIKLSLDIVSYFLDLRLQVLKDRIKILTAKRKAMIRILDNTKYVSLSAEFFIKAKKKSTGEEVKISCIYHDQERVFLTNGEFTFFSHLEPVE